MIATITHRVQVPSTQKAIALRDRCARALDEDEDATLISSSMAPDTTTFTVTGVDTASKEPFKERVEAKDAEDAGVQAVGSSKTRIVAEVRTP